VSHSGGESEKEDQQDIDNPYSPLFSDIDTDGDYTIRSNPSIYIQHCLTVPNQTIIRRNSKFYSFLGAATCVADKPSKKGPGHRTGGVRPSSPINNFSPLPSGDEFEEEESVDDELHDRTYRDQHTYGDYIMRRICVIADFTQLAFQLKIMTRVIMRPMMKLLPNPSRNQELSRKKLAQNLLLKRKSRPQKRPLKQISLAKDPPPLVLTEVSDYVPFAASPAID